MSELMTDYIKTDGPTKDMSAMETELEWLSGNLNSVFSQSERLEHKLGPVMTPAEELPEEKPVPMPGSRTAPPPVYSLLNKRLREVSDGLREVERRLTSICERLEL